VLLLGNTKKKISLTLDRFCPYQEQISLAQGHLAALGGLKCHSAAIKGAGVKS
jgi:hypothetical protein